MTNSVPVLRSSSRPPAPNTLPGRPDPFGATWDGSGTNFALFSEVAHRVELCLFDEAGSERRVDLVERTGFRWHAYLPYVGPGQRYGYRVHGPWEPTNGHRCNPFKLLLDPYARAIDGEVQAAPETLGHRGSDPMAQERDERDSAAFVPRSVVVSPYFDWGADHAPRVPWNETVIYELHVKGFTRLHPSVPETLRGTYAGLSHPDVIDHLVRLGVTTVELLPIHAFTSEPHLLRRGLTNHWGYNTIGYFAPHAAYARERGKKLEQGAELKQTIKVLHEAGLEVILDVVYNHTGEGSQTGPTLSFRGLDNAAYYRLAEDRRQYADVTGCGNTLDATRPHVLQLIMDSLRYWVEEFRVDGFRFDLATALARGTETRDRLSAFLDVVQQDPIVSRVKLVAEPWDVGPDGYQVGRFPPLWSEWNGKYRDAVRSFWRGDRGMIGELATRLSGSADLYATTGRKPFASVNFVTAHDGFTLRDLVSYERKHNEANGEENRDGTDDNRSVHCGVEGPTHDAAVNALRARQARNLIATLLLSQGVPHVLAGDEIGRTQGGNNNAYCLDDETSWVDWATRDRDLRAFVTRVLALRAAHPALRRHTFFRGRRPGDDAGAGLPDVSWFHPAGREMTMDDWSAPDARALAYFVNGDAIGARDRHGQPLVDDSFFVMLASGTAATAFTLPSAIDQGPWLVALDTTGEFAADACVPSPAGGWPLAAPGVRVLQSMRPRMSLLPPPPR